MERDLGAAELRAHEGREAGVQEKCGIVQFASNGREAKEAAGKKSQRAWKVMVRCSDCNR